MRAKGRAAARQDENKVKIGKSKELFNKCFLLLRYRAIYFMLDEGFRKLSFDLACLGAIFQDEIVRLGPSKLKVESKKVK